MRENNNIFYYSLGRNAIYAVFKMLNLSSVDEVLTPAWDCDGTLESFRAIGCKPVFYRSNPYTFEIDLDHVYNLITPKTKLIHVINHFGQPQPWDKILKFRKDVNIPILEDNAYSFGSGTNDKKFGDFGDFSIFSLRKNLPLPDGGLLKINCGLEYERHINNFRLLYQLEYKKAFYLFVNYFKQKIGLGDIHLLSAFRKKRTISKYLPPLYSDERQDFPAWNRGSIGKDFAIDYERPMSKISELIYKYYKKSRLERIAYQKRKYYSVLVNELKDTKGVQILHPELKNGVVPYCLSILVEKNRDNILALLQGKKYPVMAWPTLPIEVLMNLNRYPEVKLLGQKILQINLIFNISLIQYKQICKDLKNLIKRV